MSDRLIIATLLLALGASAQDARSIVAESQKRGQSKSQRYEGSLEVIGSSSAVSIKRWTFQRIGAYGDSKVLLRFTAPAEIKGVALLIVNHADRASEQWMWTPAIGRERRIALQDRSTRFFGTGFSFEDLEERDVNQFDYKTLGQEAVDGAACWKIEARPKESKASQYTSSVLFIRKDNYLAAIVEDYSKDKLVRRIHNTDIQKIGGIWTARNIEVFEEATKSRTVLKLDKLENNVPMDDAEFSVEALRRN